VTAAAPSGVVTFLFTDIEGSTRRWETDAEAMRAAHSIVINPKQPRTEEANGTEAAHPFVSVVRAAWLLVGQPGVTETRSIADALQRA
jgi:hypothetical protein